MNDANDGHNVKDNDKSIETIGTTFVVVELIDAMMNDKENGEAMDMCKKNAEHRTHIEGISLE